MKKTLILPAVLLVAVFAGADNQYDRDEMRERHDFQDMLWLGTQTAFTGTWTCDSGSELCTAVVAGSASTTGMAAGDKIVLLASDSKYHSYEVDTVVDDDNFTRVRWVSNDTEDPLLGVTASTCWEMNSGLPASTPADLYDGAGTITPLALSAQEVQVGHNGLDGKLDIYSEQGTTDYAITFQPHATMTQSTTYTWPADDGTASQFLQSNGSGALTWATVAEADTLQTVTNRGATTTSTVTFSGASAVLLTGVNAAGGSANPWDYTGTLGIMDNADDFTLFDVNLTNADHTGTGNTVQIIDIAAITGDAQATETAINIGAGWDNAIAAAAPIKSTYAWGTTGLACGGTVLGNGFCQLSSTGFGLGSGVPILFNSTTAINGTADLKLSRYEGLDGQGRLEFDTDSGTVSDGTGTGGIIVGAGTATWPAVGFGTGGNVGWYEISDGLLGLVGVLAPTGNIGAAPAATCTAGTFWIDTDETDDTNCTTTADNSLCLCVAANTWVAFENN